MRKMVAVAGLVVFVMALISGVAYAGQTYRYEYLPVVFSTNIGHSTQTDSLAIYAPNSADVQDTSAIITLPPDFVYATASDSIPCFVLRAERSAAGASGDTLYAVVQPSVSWNSFTEHSWLPTYTLISGTATSGAQAYRPATSYATSTNWVNVAPAYGVRYVRVRLYADGTAATSGGGTVKVWLGYLSNKSH